MADDPRPDPQPDPTPGPEPTPDPAPEPEQKPQPDWKRESRKHEDRAKKAAKEVERLQQELKGKDDADKSEQQKAIDAAREEGKNAALTEAQKDWRHDRLEAKCATVAARGIKVGQGDDAKTLKFADPDDALVYIERAIRENDVDEDEIFDSEGKVNTDALQAALADLLERKPHLAGGDANAKPSGDPDSRKGDPAQQDLESMSPEDHARRKYGGDQTAPTPAVTGARRGK